MTKERRDLLSWRATLAPRPEPFPEATDDDRSPLDEPNVRRSSTSTTVGS